MLKLLALAAVLSTTACTDDLATERDGVLTAEATYPPGPPAGEQRLDRGAASDADRPDTGELRAGVRAPRGGEDEGADVCGHLPADGACALACDPEAMIAAYVPAGTCVTFKCDLDTGVTLITGGCHE